MPTFNSSPPAGTSRDARGVLVLLCGRSFSGKSTAAARLQQSLPARLVSLDAINAERGLAGGQGISVQEWTRTNEEAKRRVGALLRAGGTVVVDDTASPRFLRDGWRAVAEHAGAVFVLVFLDTAPETIRARLLRNRGVAERHDVIDAVMDEHLQSFEEPGPDEAAVVIDSQDASHEDLAAQVQSALHGRHPG